MIGLELTIIGSVGFVLTSVVVIFLCCDKKQATKVGPMDEVVVQSDACEIKYDEPASPIVTFQPLPGQRVEAAPVQEQKEEGKASEVANLDEVMKMTDLPKPQDANKPEVQMAAKPQEERPEKPKSQEKANSHEEKKSQDEEKPQEKEDEKLPKETKPKKEEKKKKEDKPKKEEKTKKEEKKKKEEKLKKEEKTKKDGKVEQEEKLKVKEIEIVRQPGSIEPLELLAKMDMKKKSSDLARNKENLLEQKAAVEPNKEVTEKIKPPIRDEPEKIEKKADDAEVQQVVEKPAEEQPKPAVASADKMQLSSTESARGLSTIFSKPEPELTMTPLNSSKVEHRGPSVIIPVTKNTPVITPNEPSATESANMEENSMISVFE